MTAALTAQDLTLLRDALAALRARQNTVSDFASRHLQGSPQTALLLATGARRLEIDALDARLRDAHALLTGAPAVAHRNTDIHDPATEAQEANTRG